MVCKGELESAIKTEKTGMTIDESPEELSGSVYHSRCKIFPLWIEGNMGFMSI